MTRQIVFTPNAAKPPPMYSQAVKAAGLIFVSGTAPTDPATGTFKGETIQEQTHQCLTNISAILQAAGSSLELRPKILPSRDTSRSNFGEVAPGPGKEFRGT